MRYKRKVSREHTRVRIQLLAKMGYSLKQISVITKTGISTVLRWVHRTSVHDRKRSGRPKKLSTRDKRQISDIMQCKLGSSLRKTTKLINSAKQNIANNKTVCFNTVQNYLKNTDWGKHAYKSSSKPKITRKNIDDRIKFGTEVEKSGYLTPGPRGEKLRSNIFFTDESMIELDAPYNPQNCRYRTRSRSDVPPIVHVKFPSKIMVAGGFSSFGVSQLHFVENFATVDANYYQEKILPIYFEATNSTEDKLVKNITFQQDGAGSHRAKSTMEILNKRFKRV